MITGDMVRATHAAEAFSSRAMSLDILLVVVCVVRCTSRVWRNAPQELDKTSCGVEKFISGRQELG
jgi:hypothetical protein